MVRPESCPYRNNSSGSEFPIVVYFSECAGVGTVVRILFHVRRFFDQLVWVSRFKEGNPKLSHQFSLWEANLTRLNLWKILALWKLVPVLNPRISLTLWIGTLKNLKDSFKLFDLKWPHVIDSVKFWLENSKKASNEAHDLYQKNRSSIASEPTPGRQLLSFAHRCQYNVIVTEDFALFGPDFENVKALYPISKSKKLFLVVHLSKVCKKNTLSRFQGWRLGGNDQKVNFESYHMSHFSWLIS